jgi:UDP-glucuronate 4-epimerase
MKVLVTGAAGFIGFHVAMALVRRRDDVVGVDSLNAYYDPALKQARLETLALAARSPGSGSFAFLYGNLADKSAVAESFSAGPFDRVIHMAAQAGIRHSVDHPEEYVEANLVAFLNLLQACRHARVPHLTYASTSSVYGANALMPYSEHHGADHPLQFYAATKRANELMAHAYSQMFGLPTTGLRFFTVYGPWGRPDMALFRFTRAILAGEPVELYNQGNHTRDFTYIDDIVEDVIRASDVIATADPHWDPRAPDPATSAAPWRLFNIGGSNPVGIGAYVDALEAALGVPAQRVLLPRQPGDALDTHADTSELAKAVGYRPGTPVTEGVRRFVEWYRDYYRA